MNVLYGPSIINYQLLAPHSVLYWPSTQLHHLITHSWANWIWLILFSAKPNKHKSNDEAGRTVPSSLSIQCPENQAHNFTELQFIVQRCQIHLQTLITLQYSFNTLQSWKDKAMGDKSTYQSDEIRHWDAGQLEQNTFEISRTLFLCPQPRVS